MRCPKCYHKNKNDTLHCVHCGANLNYEEQKDAVSIALIVLAALQVLALVVVFALLSNGTIAAAFLSCDEITKAARISSVFHSAEKNEAFSRLVKINTDFELDEFMNGSQSADDTIAHLQKYYKLGTASAAVADSAIVTVQDACDLLNTAQRFADEGKIYDAVQTYRELGERLEGFQDKAENLIHTLVDDTFSDIETNLAATEHLSDTVFFYEDAALRLRDIVRADISPDYNSKAADQLLNVYADWRDDCQSRNVFWGKNGAFALAKICESYNSTGYYISTTNAACTGYFNAQISEGNAESVYRELLGKAAELQSYSDIIDIDVYDRIREQALNKWKQTSCSEYISLANEIRRERGLPEFESNSAADNVAAVLNDNPDQWEDDAFVRETTLQNYGHFSSGAWESSTHSVRASEAIRISAERADSVLYMEGALHIGVAVKLNQQTVSFDWVVVVLRPADV